MYGLFGKMLAYPGRRDELVGHLLHAAAMMRDLDSCHVYIINVDPNDPDAVWVNEVWRSKEDHDESLTHEATKALIAVARPLIAGFGERFEVTTLGGKGLPETSAS